MRAANGRLERSFAFSPPREPRDQPGAEKVEAAFEGSSISTPVELGLHESEYHVRELAVKLGGLGR
jgi:hypothetical protein